MKKPSMNKPKAKSDAFEAIHASAIALHKIGAINKSAMRNFDAASLMPMTEILVARIHLNEK